MPQSLLAIPARLLRLARVARLAPAESLPVVGALVASQYIPARWHRGVGVCAHGAVDIPWRAAPFWAITIQSESGEYLHANVPMGANPPPLGTALSVVARKERRGLARRVSVVRAILRPPLPVGA